MISKHQADDIVHRPDTVILTILERRPLKRVSRKPAKRSGQSSLSDRRRRSCRRWKMPRGFRRSSRRITAVPVATGKFNTDFDLTGSELPDWIVAGMSCKVKVTTYDKEDALVVPKKAVHTDKDDEELKYVWLMPAKATDAKKADVKPERRNVKLGKTSGDNVEIANGLTAGDVFAR